MRDADHYAELQVARSAETEVIEKAYRALAAKYHPDAGPTGDGSRMRRINAAYAVLRDPVRRAEYDRSLPVVAPGGWEVFWDSGLIGLYRQRRRTART